MAGMIFVKKAVRARIPSDLVEPPPPANAAGSPAEGRYPFSDNHKRLLMIFGFVLILAALVLTFCNRATLPLAILAVVAGLIFVKWAVREAPAGKTPTSCLHVFGWIIVTMLALGILIPLAAYHWENGRFTWPGRNGTRGSGHVITEARTVALFSHISASGIDVLNITQGEPQSLTIAADDNILPLFETEVTGDTLRISRQQRNWGWGCVGMSISNPVTINVTLKQISKLEVSGGARIRAGNIVADDLAIEESGATELAITALKAQTLNVRINGSADCNLAGRADKQTIAISGSGHYQAGKLASQSAALAISGSGDAEVWAAETLDLSISGSGSIEYHGRPRLTQRVSGSGRVMSLDKP
jgi:hypothetical protein